MVEQYHPITEQGGLHIQQSLLITSNLAQNLSGVIDGDNVPIPFLFRRFELATAWAVESEGEPLKATAYPLRHNNSTGEYEPDESTTFDIYAVVSDVAELTRSGESVGSWGLAWHPHDVTGGRWEVVVMNQQGAVRFELKGPSEFTFNPGDDADALVVRGNGTFLDPDDNQVIRVYDSLEFYRGGFTLADNGTRGWARYMPDMNRYEITSPRDDEILTARGALQLGNYLPSSGASTVPFDTEIAGTLNTTVTTGVDANIEIEIAGSYMIDFAMTYVAETTPNNDPQQLNHVNVIVTVNNSVTSLSSRAVFGVISLGGIMVWGAVGQSEPMELSVSDVVRLRVDPDNDNLSLSFMSLSLTKQ